MHQVAVRAGGFEHEPELETRRGLDRTETKKYTGLAWYRQAMLSRARWRSWSSLHCDVETPITGPRSPSASQSTVHIMGK